MEKRYIVVSLAVSGKGNKIFRSGDEVKAGQTNVDVDTLVKEGHLQVVDATDTMEKEVKVPQAPVEVEVETETETETDATDTTEKEPLFLVKDKDGNDKQVFGIDDITLKEIKAELKAKEIEFNPISDKATLFELLVNSL